MARAFQLVDDAKMTTTDQLLTRLSALEQRVYELEVARLPGASSPTPAERSVDASPPAELSPMTPPPPRERDARSRNRRSRTAGQRRAPASEVLLRWVGVGLVFLAAAFLVSTAVSRGWIGPELQLAGAAAIGAALIAWALRLAPARDGWALAAGHGGAAVLGASAFLGYETLDLYGLGAAVAATAGSALVSFWLSLRLERASIAGNGVLQAVAIPAIMGVADFYSATAVGAWLTVLIAGSAALSWRRRWPALRLTLFAIVAVPLLVIAEDVSRGSNLDVTIAVAVGLFAIAVFVLGPPIEAAIPHRQSSNHRRVDLGPLTSALDQRLYTILPVWAWGLFALLFFGERDGAPWLAVGIAAGSAIGLIALRSHLLPAMFAAGAVGASVLLSIGVAGLIEGPGLLVALTVQAVGLTWLAARFKDVLLGINAAVIGTIAGVWGGLGIVSAMFEGASFGEHVAHLVVAMAIAAAALVGRNRRWCPPVALAAWGAWLGWLAAVFGELPQGQMAVSIAWALCGAALFVLGLHREDRRIANVGLVTLGVTVIKLVTVDLDAVDTMWRAGLFFLVGIGLLRLGLLIGDPDDGEPREHGSTDLRPGPGDEAEAGPLLSSHE